MGKNKKKIKPSKVIITMGETLTRTDFSGPVSAVNLINACIHLVTDIKTTAGMPESGSLSIICEKFGYKIEKMEPNATMRASKSEKTANTEGS